jgi:glycosyltransferase involved in cell wall biosynthesis
MHAVADIRASSPAPGTLRVAHVISSLETGGAEMMLSRLVERLYTRGFPSLVICLGRDGRIGERIRAAGVETRILNLTARLSSVRNFWQAATFLRLWQPDLIQGWMYHGNVAASLLRRLAAPRARLMWNIRCTVRELSDYLPLTQRVIRVNAWLSRRPEAVIYNSEAAVGQHEALGFRPRRSLVLPNGFDLDHYSRSEAGRSVVRRELGVRPDELLVGLIARYHAMKDFPTFIAAAGRLVTSRSNVRVLVAGPGVDPLNRELAGQLARAGISSSAIVRGEFSDMMAALSALDVFCLSSSWGEGFPNVVGEAMACGTPCVGTDVGDFRQIVGDTGFVVAPDDPVALAAALEGVLALAPERRAALGEAARARVRELYDINSILERYLQTYLQGFSTEENSP